MRTRTVAVPLAVLAAGAGLAAGAYAASQPGARPQKALRCGSQKALVNDAARRLHVTPTRLTDALKQAAVDQIDAAVAAGRLSGGQAGAIKGQIERGPGLSLGLGLLGPEVKAAQVVSSPGLHLKAIHAPGPLAPSAIVTSAARYLGLTDGQLKQRLGRGESLAQIAKARGKSKRGLEQAITAAVKSQLENALRARRITRAQELRLLAAFTRNIQDIVSTSGPLGLALPSGGVRMSRAPGVPVAPGRIHIQVRAAGPPQCLAGAVGLMPPPLVRTMIGPAKP